jgi:hypothetical protein
MKAIKLNQDAIIAWMYIWETVYRCPSDEVDRGYEFRRLLCDLMEHYPNEYEAMIAVHDAQQELED